MTYSKESAAGVLTYPFGHDADGILIYSIDGCMSAQLMAAGRSPIGATDASGANNGELAAMSKGFFGYSGRYEVEPDENAVYHHVLVSLVPDLIGTCAKRHFEFHGSILWLSHEREGRKTQLTWQRLTEIAVGKVTGRWKMECVRAAEICRHKGSGKDE